MEEDLLKKKKAFSFIVAFLTPFCFPKVNPESVKIQVCPKLFYIMMKQM